MHVRDRFLNYVHYDTQSDASSSSSPSTEKQRRLAFRLVSELKEMGVSDAEVDGFGVVYGHLPASAGCTRPGLMLCAHMDTATDMSGADIKPHIIEQYDGKDIVLNEEMGIVTRRGDFPILGTFIGQDLIVTDGTTLLGADDKAGIAEIMSLLEFLMENPDWPHPPISILFTPDEEIGRGPDHVDLARVGAAYGYTVDGGILGEFSYENFNAAAARVIIHGVTAHTGYARGILKNAALFAMEFQQLLPPYETPACTDGRDGFYHLQHIDATSEKAVLEYLIRDFGKEAFASRKKFMAEAADFLNRKYGHGTCEIEITDSYYNMIAQIEAHSELIHSVFEAMGKVGVTPIVNPARGGTDGARFSFMGVPCPNLCSGGVNGHGRHEFVSVQAMEKIVEILKQLVTLFA